MACVSASARLVLDVVEAGCSQHSCDLVGGSKMVDVRVDPCRGLVVVGAAGDHEGAAGPQDAGDVGDRGGWVGHEVDGVGGDRGVGAVVGEGNGDAVAESQGGAAAAAGGTVARRGLLDHRGR